MKILALILSLVIISCTATAQTKQSSGVPLSINKIETYRIKNQVVRIIKHNMEINPKIELELIKTPELTIQDYLVIASVKTPNREYIFKKSDGVFVEALDVDGDEIQITFEYYVPKGSTIALNCKIIVSEKAFEPTQCKEN